MLVSPTHVHRRTPRLTTVFAVSISLALVLSPAGAQAQAPPTPAPDAPQLEHEPLDDYDSRTAVGAIPAAAARETARDLDATVRWNRFGTAGSLIRRDGFLATGVPGTDATDAARAWLEQHRQLYRLDSTDSLDVQAEVPLSDDAYVVIFQQRVHGLPVSPDGSASVGLTGSAKDGWDVAYTSASLVAPRAPAGARSFTARQAVAAAADNAGIDTTGLAATGARAGWTIFDLAGADHEQLVRPVVFPTPSGNRLAYETVYYDGMHEGYRYIVDAGTGDVRYRESIVHDDDEATWQIYPDNPPTRDLAVPPWLYPSLDLRELWCWTPTARCERVLDNEAARVSWDVDAETGTPTFTTTGNAVDAAEWWSGGGGGPGQQPVSEARRYRFPWQNSWYRNGCHPDNLVPGGNDIDASVTNLFAANSRMHDWSYRLGFTEETWNAQEFNFDLNPDGQGDPVTARAQSGAVTGSRNNASMATLPDGFSSVMNMFLWQPEANSFYGPCAVGDFDLSVIGHEYTHMIENRMIGNGFGRSGFHAGAMGESWSDFIAAEHLNEYGLADGDGVRRWTVGGYATGNPDRGIRNFNMAYPSAGQLPEPGLDPQVGALNFGSMGYDFVGPQVHADSQIWSATNHDLRTLLLDRYPSQGPDQQLECADGLRPIEQCPGNRRWIQLVFDAMLLMPTAPTMLDARDAYFAADLLRFDGANHDLLWEGFARRGFGEHASVTGTQDTDPVPSFESPLQEEATLRFEAVAQDGGEPVDAEVFAGDYEARATPLQSVERFVPHPEGYHFVARADGFGHVRFHVEDLQAGEDRTVTIHLPANVASQSQGAAASGDGAGHADLIDDTEATNWQTAPSLPNLVEVAPPSDAAGSYGAAGAQFGPDPTPEGFSGDIVLIDDGSADPTLGCEPLTGFPDGAIALIDRGVCPFTQKVANAQDAGAGAVIVANNVPGGPFDMGGIDPSITIPSVMISLVDGATIKAGLPATGTVAAVESDPAAGSQVTIALDGEQSFRLAKASAMLLPGQNRFTALRQFELYACTAGGAVNPDCDGTTGAGWDRILRSGQDAFPAPNPRPSAPDLALRSFPVPNTTATHVKFVVLANQCTGNPHYQGEQDDDPATTTDCRSSSVGTDEVRAAELQLLTGSPQVDGATAVD